VQPKQHTERLSIAANSEMKMVIFPKRLGEALESFMLDKQFGTVTLMVQNGQIVRMVFETSIKP
jgi:hypothetical protein